MCTIFDEAHYNRIRLDYKMVHIKIKHLRRTISTSKSSTGYGPYRMGQIISILYLRLIIYMGMNHIIFRFDSTKLPK